MMPAPVTAPLLVDPMLVAQVQARTNGQTIHRIASMLAAYEGYAVLRSAEKFRRVEEMLRAFTRTGQLPAA
jgi:hypothetical protein